MFKSRLGGAGVWRCGPPFDSPAALPPGTSGGDVLQAQRYLQRFGYFRGKLDGRLGPETQAALEAFKARFKVPRVSHVTEKPITK